MQNLESYASVGPVPRCHPTPLCPTDAPVPEPGEAPLRVLPNTTLPPSGSDLTPMHRHRRAQRYMEKRVLRDLWRVWRDSFGEEGQPSVGAHVRSADLPTLLLELKETHHRRQDLLLAEGNLTRQIKGICRRLCGGDLEKAGKLYKAMTPDALGACAPHLAARAVLTAELKAPEKRMKQIARQLPAHDWVKSIKGFGEMNFAILIAEAGDLRNYANPGKLWRRFGLAPIEGKALSTWRRFGGFSAKDWEAAGYSPRRRALIFVVGDCLIKKQNAYRELYLARKATP